jgi:aldehyde dehydrogenase (NAD+)
LAALVGHYLAPDAVTVVEGGPEVAQGLLAERWDHIFFTGGGRVGRLVMLAAAAHLTPVTLELGGKNPALVTEQADVAAAARRIAWGRFLNAGQTCAAPDFVLVHEQAKDRLVEALAQRAREFYGADPAHSADFGRIVNQAHLARLVGLLARTAGKVVTGGQSDLGARYLAPTIVSEVGWDDALMEDEIFGPVLPVLSYRSLPQVLEQLAGRDKPLALYVYTEDRAQADEVIAGTSSGTVCVNHNAVQLAVPGLPFGGVGASGMGAYNGRTGFDTFSHLKGVLRKPARAEVALMYPPYTPAKRAALRTVLR